MTALALDLFHTGVVIGLGVGVLLAICAQEVAREFRRWRLHLAQQRTIARWCDVTNDCRASRGHAPPCEPWDESEL